VQPLGGELLQPGRINRETIEGEVLLLAGPWFSGLDDTERPIDKRAFETSVSILEVCRP
jgi:hypothetical protein